MNLLKIKKPRKFEAFIKILKVDYSIINFLVAILLPSVTFIMYTPEAISETLNVLFIEEKRWLNTFQPNTLNMFTVLASVLEVVTVKVFPRTGFG